MYPNIFNISIINVHSDYFQLPLLKYCNKADISEIINSESNHNFIIIVISIYLLSQPQSRLILYLVHTKDQNCYGLRMENQIFNKRKDFK